MEWTQKTISKEGHLAGIGIHTGEPSEVFFKPAPLDHGIHFFKKDQAVAIFGKDTSDDELGLAARCSAIGSGKTQILTVEHLLAAIQGFGITNLVVEVHGSEIPGLDGSALPFIELFKRLGVKDQQEAAFVYRIQEPIFCHEPAKAISIYPSENFEISYLLDYDHPYLRNQRTEFMITPEIFASEIAPARTFVTEKETRELAERGFGLGANAENTVVVTETGSHLKDLRFPDECVRHKILDIVGDLSLLGYPVIGRVEGLRSGHSLNRKLVQEIRRQRKSHGK